MSNSSLVTYTQISPNRNSPRNHAIDRISIHCFVGQVTAQSGCREFASSSKGASCNYVVGYDGSIGLCVPESDRSWCTSSPSNDHRGVTIETASDRESPYAVTDKAYKALVDLCEDICRRNGKTKLLWFGDKDKSLNYTPAADEMVMTVHRWFANKSCPGEYLYERHPQIAAEVTRRLSGESVSYLVVIDTDDLNIRSGPGANYGSVGVIAPGKYTIVAESDGEGAGKWGLLKSGAGWISLDYAKKEGEEPELTESDVKKLARQEIEAYFAEQGKQAASEGWGETITKWAKQARIAGGDPDGNMRPRSHITREESFQVVKNALESDAFADRVEEIVEEVLENKE